MTDSKDQKEGQIFTLEQERVRRDLQNNLTNPHAKELATKFKLIDPDVLKEANKVLQDPNKMKDTAYQQWIKALAKGRFPQRGKFALKFLRSLDGTPREQKYARKLISTLSEDAAGPLSEKVQKDHLKTLHLLREEDLKQQALEKTSSTTSAIVATAETREKIEKITEVKTDSWELEPADRKTREKLDKLDLAKLGLMKKYTKIDGELQSEEESGIKNEGKIKKLKKELLDLDKKIEDLDDQMAPLKVKEDAYMERNMSRFYLLKRFAVENGLDLRKLMSLVTWDYKKTAGRQSINGLTLNLPDGDTKSQITVKRVFFQRKEDSQDTAPGQLMIDYVDEDGTPANPLDRHYRKFAALLKASRAYEPLNNLEDFYSRAKENCQYRMPQPGQVFTANIATDFEDDVSDSTDEYLKYEKKQFTILDVQTVGRETKIVLDKKITFFGTNILNLGQFAQYIKKHDFRREILSREDLKEVLEKQAKATQETCQDFIKGASTKEQELYTALNGVPKKEELTAELPDIGQEKNVVFINPETRRKYDAKLRVIPGKDGEEKYAIEYEERLTGTDGPISMPRVPDSMRTASMNIVPPAKRKHPKVVKHVFDRRSFQELNNKNAVQEVAPPPSPSTPPTPPTSLPPSEGMGENAEEEKTAPEDKDLEAQKKQIYKEALEYDKVNKMGNFAREEQGFLKTLWLNTRILSAGDIWELGKAGYEYYIRRFERRQKERFSSVAKEVPFFAPEMQRVNQQAETDQVNSFKEAFDQFGVDQIMDRLKNTKVRDEMKSAFIVLGEKGQMRWDDIGVWKNLNRFITDPALKIPIPRNGDPFTKISDVDERTGFDFLKEGIDSLWGQGQYNDWYRQGKSTYIQNARSHYEKGKELENLQGGHERRLGALLKLHKQGTWVDPQEYEGLILHSIEMGKSSMQAKLYFMVEGAAAKNPNGDTILSFDRMAHINSEMLPRFPILEYMTARAQRFDPKTGKVKEHRFTKDDFEQWVHKFDDGDPGNPEKCKPGEAVNKFLWEYVIPSDDTQNRINKAIRNGENLDHDDMFAYLPPASEGIITDACKSTTGSKKFFTVEGYANAFPGFSQYIRSLSEHDKKNKLMEAIKSYVRYEGIITDKYEKSVNKAQDSYQRFDDVTLRSPTIVSTEPPKYFIDKINVAVQKIIEAYGDPELTEIADKIYNVAPTIGDLNQPSERDKQHEVNYAYQRFSKVFNRVVQGDKGQTMVNVINASDLPDMPYRPTHERKRAPSDTTNELSIE